MNFEIILTILVLLLGYVWATDQSTPQCQDLDRIQRQLTNTMKLVPNSKVSCKRNNNCTGLICDGKVNGKAFHAIVILEGCHEPVRMVIHVNKRSIYVTNGYKKQIVSKPFPVTAEIGLVKKGDIILVSVTLNICLFGDVCTPYRILKNQVIRVHCNVSTVHAKNPECEGLMTAKKQVERRFKLVQLIYRDAKILCNPSKNCSELQCSGVANGNHFHSRSIIDYCSDPMQLRFALDVPNRKIHFSHDFKNGDSFKILKIPHISMKVYMRRVRNIIFLTVSIQLLGKGYPLLGKGYPLVKNMSINVDPSHCQGYIYDGLPSGLIGGVVVAVIVFFVILIAVIVWIVRGKRQRSGRYDDVPFNNDTNSLVFHSDAIA